MLHRVLLFSAQKDLEAIKYNIIVFYIGLLLSNHMNKYSAQNRGAVTVFFPQQFRDQRVKRYKNRSFYFLSYFIFIHFFAVTIFTSQIIKNNGV